MPSIDASIARYAARFRPDRTPRTRSLPPHLQALEAEAIHIMRDVAGAFGNPVLLYSIGKDSTCLLHLALKAFWPSRPPFRLLHIDSLWEVREMARFRDGLRDALDLDLTVYVNREGADRDINPFISGTALHTQVMRTDALLQALDRGRYDAIFGGGRRDEEKSRAKERIFSFRDRKHVWDPRNQRPELWRLYNTRLAEGESMRVFPLSNWTELDIWQYISEEEIPVVPLYFAAPRPVVDRDGTLIMVDDDRMPLARPDEPQTKTVRFRTLGCYPLTGAVESDARSADAIVAELIATRSSERAGRLIDHDDAASMEVKTREGYF